MKRLLLISVAFCLAFAATTSLHAQTNKPKKLTKAEKAALMMQTIQTKTYSKDFSVEIKQVTPMRSAAQKVDPGYVFRVKGDSLFCDMPYIGDATTMSYTGYKGMTFDERIRSYSVVQLNESCYAVFMKVVNNEDSYDMQLEFFDNSFVKISVNPVRRDPISYIGQLKLPKEQK